MSQQAGALRQWYARLLRLYPGAYRNRMGESMEQTFNDLCRERREAGEKMLGFVLWTFADTFVGILKEDMRVMALTVKRYGQILLSVIAAISMVATALVTRDTENQNAFFFVLAAYFVLMAAIEVYARRRKNL